MNEPKLCYSFEKDLSVQHWEDNSGVYSENNPGGYGSPNATRRSFAILALMFFKPFNTEKVEAEYLTPQLVYDAGFDDTEKSKWSMTYNGVDGYRDAYFFWIPDVAPNSDDGTVYYNAPANQVLISVGGTFEEVTDYETLIGNTSINQLNSPQFPIGTASNKFRDIQEDNLNKRMSGDKDADKQSIRANDFFIRLDGAVQVFNSGAPSQAQNYLENLSNESC